MDKDNDLAAVEYVEDMYTFYKEVEVLIVKPSFVMLMDKLCDVFFKFVVSSFFCCRMRPNLRCICIHNLRSMRR